MFTVSLIGASKMMFIFLLIFILVLFERFIIEVVIRGYRSLLLDLVLEDALRLLCV
jgi:hypothetical protein